MKMRAQLVVFILLFTASWKRGNCVIQTAVEGLSTNTIIQCDLDEQMAAPFWRINDHVYDIFHIPPYFKVESYTALTIPEVSRSFNDYTFQCVLIDHTTDQIREIHGTLTELTVIENTINDRVPTLVPRDLLELDYQQLRVDSDYITIGWIYSFSDCDISHFTLEGFELDDVLTNSLQEPTLVHNSTTNTVAIPLRNVFNNSGLYFRLSSFGKNGELCGQDIKSQQIFYNLHTITGTSANDELPTVVLIVMYISFHHPFIAGTHEVVYGIPGETVCVPIPDNFTDGEMATPVFVWPANPGIPGDCYCPPYENVELTRFSDCIVTCNTTYSIESVNESICFSNFTFSMNNTQVYFVTLTDQCDFPDCFIRTTVGSYRIIIIGYPEPPTISYLKSNNSLCFSAYSDPRYPVLSYSVNITTQSDTIMKTLSSHHCISLPGDLSDSCESFTVSATSSNAIGTSNITFQSGGVPCAPKISYTSNSICFSPHSTFQFLVDYYDVNVTDVTGLQTDLTGTYSSSQCLPLVSEPYPNVCRPFQVTATATNAYGTSNMATYNSTTNNRPEELTIGCDCYQKRDQILNVDVLEVSDSTAIITLTCGLDTSHVKDFTLQQEGNNIRNVVTMCNISTTISGLVSGRVYAIVRTYNHQITCTLTSFNTTLKPTSPPLPLHVLILVIVLSVLVIVIVIIVVVAVVYGIIVTKKKRKKRSNHVSDSVRYVTNV